MGLRLDSTTLAVPQAMQLLASKAHRRRRKD